MHVAFTIASKNYISIAGVLASSYKKHHPDGHFIIILCDRSDNHDIDRHAGGAEVIQVSDISIPDFNSVVYRYSIMELNTAVKPFVFEYLFRTRPYDRITYLDPDIWIHRPLEAVFSALDTADIALIPHIRRPYFDRFEPTDTRIIQSGTFNLGFIALKRGLTADRLLSWWSEKLFLDCVVDIPRGLFVDQKWLDLVPSFFPSHAIIYDPTCNIAYWNLHERTLSVNGDGHYTVDGAPLTFFHFSGYSPFEPARLSKHQDRHRLRWNPALRRLCQEYSNALFANGYETTATWPYSYEVLPNGVHLPMKLVRDAVQWAVRHEMDIPDPIADADGFCAFLMSRRGRQNKIPFVLDLLLQRRPDVAAAFPAAHQNPEDPNFRRWLHTNGETEEGTGDLLEFENREPDNRVAAAFALLRDNKRTDVLEHFENLWHDRTVFENFAGWFETHGVAEHAIPPGYGTALKAAYNHIGQILHLYFLRGDLQLSFPALEGDEDSKGFTEWLIRNGGTTRISAEAASLFSEFLAGSRKLVGNMRFLYQHFGEPRVPASIFLLEERRRNMPAPPPLKDVSEALLGDELIDINDQYNLALARGVRLGPIEEIRVPFSSAQRSFNIIRTIGERQSKPDRSGNHVNFASFMNAPSGMGESARSMQRALLHTSAAIHQCILPHPDAQLAPPVKASVFGWPSPSSAVSITVANADSTEMTKAVLPPHYWTDRDIGYWVWETEELPRRFEDAANSYAEVWTPSEYSAAAIRRITDKDVVVMPHTLDLEAIAGAKGNRARFGLPEDGILFGFMFDPQSVLERKNLRGLLKAYKSAFTSRDNTYLVVKVNGRDRQTFEYKWLRAQMHDPHILYVEDTLSRSETFDFMATLDVYVSLHRSEGFGLTCAEAMAMGKPVIATGYSGNLDFMTEQNSVLIPARVIETDRAYGPYPAGSRWGDPDLDAAAEAMRGMLKSSRRIELARIAKGDIVKRLDVRGVAAKIAARLNLDRSAAAGAQGILYGPDVSFQPFPSEPAARRAGTRPFSGQDLDRSVSPGHGIPSQEPPADEAGAPGTGGTGKAA